MRKDARAGHGPNDIDRSDTVIVDAMQQTRMLERIDVDVQPALHGQFRTQLARDARQRGAYGCGLTRVLLASRLPQTWGSIMSCALYAS